MGLHGETLIDGGTTDALSLAAQVVQAAALLHTLRNKLMAVVGNTSVIADQMPAEWAQTDIGLTVLDLQRAADETVEILNQLSECLHPR